VYILPSLATGNIFAHLPTFLIQMNHIHHVLLKGFDYKLYHKLQQAHVLPQMYLLRWIRLLFAREFRLQQVFYIWGELLQNLDLIDFLCVSLTISSRAELFTAEQKAGDGALLAALLKPSAFAGNGPSEEEMHRGLVEHARALMEGKKAFMVVPKTRKGVFFSRVWNKVVKPKKTLVTAHGKIVKSLATLHKEAVKRTKNKKKVEKSASKTTDSHVEMEDKMDRSHRRSIVSIEPRAVATASQFSFNPIQRKPKESKIRPFIPKRSRSPPPSRKHKVRSCSQCV
jgi:hypothetical protein